MQEIAVTQASKTFHHGQYSVLFFINKEAHIAARDDEDALDDVTLFTDAVASKITEAFRSEASGMAFWKVRDESSDKDSWIYPFVTCDFQGSEFRESELDAYDITVATEIAMGLESIVAFRSAAMEIASRVASEAGATVEFITVSEYAEYRVSETRRLLLP